MPKFSGKPTRPNIHGAVQTTGPDVTYEGGQGYARDPHADLFLLAVSNFVSENSFYEGGKGRDDRFNQLVHEVTRIDPDWVRRFIPWLRNTAQMRTASLVAAAEYVKAGGPEGRKVISAALSRADEPAEMLAYWYQTHGKKVPMAVKRGVADAVNRLYNERSALKYDGQRNAWRFGDVIELVHPSPKDQWQGDLFHWLIDKRHNRDELESPEGLRKIERLPKLTKAWELEHTFTDERRALLRADPDILDRAGWDWERLSGWLPGGMDAEAWEFAIPQMGYMALLRNLRNFDQAGINQQKVDYVRLYLTDPENVAKSRQFPIRFFSAYNAVESERWKPALETAVNLSMQNVPVLKGRTLILVDCSGSMTMMGYHGSHSKVLPWQTAGLFGSALALRAESADLFVYSGVSEKVDLSKGMSVFTALNKIQQSRAFGGGTNTMQALSDRWRGHDRVVLLTDEQSHPYGHYDKATVNSIPLIYTFNLAGYRVATLPAGEKGRYTFGGLTDAGFRLLDTLEQPLDSGWPF